MIFVINTTSDISKLLYVISRAVRLLEIIAYTTMTRHSLYGKVAVPMQGVVSCLLTTPGKIVNNYESE